MLKKLKDSPIKIYLVLKYKNTYVMHVSEIYKNITLSRKLKDMDISIHIIRIIVNIIMRKEEVEMYMDLVA